MPPKRPARYFQSAAVPSTHLKQIGMELVVAFHKTPALSEWIVVATEYMTRYAEPGTFPRGLGKRSVSSSPNFAVHGARDVLITDRGTAFTEGLMQGV